MGVRNHVFLILLRRSVAIGLCCFVILAGAPDLEAGSIAIRQIGDRRFVGKSDKFKILQRFCLQF